MGSWHPCYDPPPPLDTEICGSLSLAQVEAWLTPYLRLFRSALCRMSCPATS